MMTLKPIGVFDSGVGGLSVLREIRRELPHEDLLYVADSGHAPYGWAICSVCKASNSSLRKRFLPMWAASRQQVQPMCLPTA